MRLTELLTVLTGTAVAVIGPAAAQPCTTLPEGVIAWWSGEGDGQSASCAHHGTPVNGTSFAPGLVGLAFQLDGVNDYVHVPDAPAFDPPTGAITVEAWIRADAAPGGAVVSKYSSSSNARAWVLSVNPDGGVRLGIYNDLTDEFRVADTAAGYVQSGVFHHVAGTFDVATQELRTYVDGAEVANSLLACCDDVISALANTTAPVRIGAFVGSDGFLTGAFDGLIDEPAVYDRALAPSEIAAIHEAGTGGKCPERVRNATRDVWYGSIAEAVAEADPGDELVARPCWFQETIDFDGKALTLRSEDPSDPDRVAATIIDGSGLGDSVLRCVHNEGPDTIIDGFTVVGGAGTAVDGETYGGGLYVAFASPTVRRCVFWANFATYGGGMFNGPGAGPAVIDCTFTGNLALLSGGGMHNAGGAAPVISGCAFDDNFLEAGDGGGMANVASDPVVSDCTFLDHGSGVARGGGMYNSASSPTVSGCTFAGNFAQQRGGGMANVAGSAPAVSGCTFEDNGAGSTGAGMDNDGSDPLVSGCEFVANDVAELGGGMHNQDSSPTVIGCTFRDHDLDGSGGGMASQGGAPVLVNCVFVGNFANGGAGIWGSGTEFEITNCTFGGNAPYAIEAATSVVDVTNSILSGNAPGQMAGAGSSITVGYSNVQGGWAGPGNIDAAPIFANPSGGDLHLMPGSPGIDAGDSLAPGLAGVSTDRDGAPRFQDDLETPDCPQAPGTCGPAPVVDMGAYEAPGETGGCPEDVDGDGEVSVDDLVAVILAWGSDDPDADVDGDGVVGVDDLVAVVLAWGACG